ncbi:MAG: diacylglycerol kinase family protein [Eubacteriaceae bacterium]|nr:diacylglycerol kinase family protein [Eubacteriaceae bacterium]
MHAFIRSLKHALDGLVDIYKCERNYRIQLTIGFLAILLSFILKISATELAIITVCIGTVLTAEALNSAVERFVDALIDKPDKRAQVAKDCSAAAALIASITALAVGFLIFLPKILRILLYRQT